MNHSDIALVLGVIALNLLVDVLAVIAVIGLQADEMAREEDQKRQTSVETTLEPWAPEPPVIGLLLDRKK